MKRFLFLISIVLLFSTAVFAQAKKAAPAAKPAPVSAVAPKLGTKDPSFAGFTGSFIKFGKVSGSNRPFTMTAGFGEWAFEVSGLANAKHNTEDLDILLEDIVAVLAYYDAKGSTANGESYQAGLFDLMIYLDDEPIKVSDLNFTLTGKAAAGSAVLKQAKTWNFEPGSVYKSAKYSGAITNAQARSVDKSDIEREEAAAKKKIADSIAKEKKRVADSIAKAEKHIADSIAKEKKRKADSIAKAEQQKADSIAAEKKRIAKEKKRVADSIELAEQQKADAAAKEKKRIAAEKKRAAEALAKEEERIADSIAKEKKKIAAEKKRAAEAKRKAIEEDDDFDDEPVRKRTKRKKAEDDEPPVKKKTKKRPVVEKDDEEEWWL